MFNLWEWLVAGLIYLFDLLFIPLFELFGTIVTVGMPITNGISEYVRLAFRMIYPIVTMLNFYPFVTAAVIAIQVSVTRKLISIWHFFWDLFPGLR